MPYIKQDRRTAVDRYVSDLCGRGAIQSADMPQDCGELNYALTMACLWHKKIKFGELDLLLYNIVRNYLSDKELKYQRINDVIGATICAAYELERRLPNPNAVAALVPTLINAGRVAYFEIGVSYELKKIAENGDIAEYGSPQ